MKFNSLVYLFFLFYIILGKDNNDSLDGAYAIKEHQDIKWLNVSAHNLILEKNSKKKNAIFYIRKCDNLIQSQKDKIFYFIYIINNNNRLCINEQNNTIKFCIKETSGDILKWSIIKKENTKGYIIKNKKSGLYIGINSIYDDNLPRNILTVKSDAYNATIFQFYKIYEEHIPHDTELLKKEPIDVLIKYIDLKDPNLERNKIKQIKKDEDNDELKYCLRSILKNIPWVRKIFILMPNNNV